MPPLPAATAASSSTLSTQWAGGMAGDSSEENVTIAFLLGVSAAQVDVLRNQIGAMKKLNKGAIPRADELHRAYADDDV